MVNTIKGFGLVNRHNHAGDIVFFTISYIVTQIDNHLMYVFFVVISFLSPSGDFVDDCSQPCVNYSGYYLIIT